MAGIPQAFPFDFGRAAPTGGIKFTSRTFWEERPR